jgi:hypothetical protein
MKPQSIPDPELSLDEELVEVVGEAHSRLCACLFGHSLGCAAARGVPCVRVSERVVQ